MSERDSSLAEIQEHRAKIDEIDQQIVALLNKRAGHSLVIRGLKPGAHLGLYDAKREEGSWWPVWLGWLQERSGELGNPDFNLGSAAHPPLEAAPGTYVHIR